MTVNIERLGMRYKYETTGPFELLSIDESNPKYLILEFEDTNPQTGLNSRRKMAKGGNWPAFFAEKLLEKAAPLVGSKVFVKTSQTTKAWSTYEWLCDVENAETGSIKAGIAEQVKAADGSSNLVDSLALDSHLNLIDYSLAKDFCESEQEYEVFWKNLTDGFKASWVNSKARTLKDDVKRIRVKGTERLSKRNGYRVVVWRAFEINDVNYFVVLRVDKKLDREDFLTKEEISQISQQVQKLSALYDPEKMAEVIRHVFS